LNTHTVFNVVTVVLGAGRYDVDHRRRDQNVVTSPKAPPRYDVSPLYDEKRRNEQPSDASLRRFRSLIPSMRR